METAMLWMDGGAFLTNGASSPAPDGRDAYRRLQCFATYGGEFTCNVLAGKERRECQYR
jgi:hypothetical protein